MAVKSPAITEARRFVSEHLEMRDRVTDRLLVKMPKYRINQRINVMTFSQEFVPEILSYLGEYDDEATYGYKALTDHDDKPVAFAAKDIALQVIGMHANGDLMKTQVVFESVTRAREPSAFEAPKKKMPLKKKR